MRTLPVLSLIWLTSFVLMFTVDLGQGCDTMLSGSSLFCRCKEVYPRDFFFRLSGYQLCFKGCSHIVALYPLPHKYRSVNWQTVSRGVTSGTIAALLYAVSRGPRIVVQCVAVKKIISYAPCLNKALWISSSLHGSKCYVFAHRN